MFTARVAVKTGPVWRGWAAALLRGYTCKCYGGSELQSMTFSLEARQIHNQIVENSGTSNYWTQAASAATKRGKFAGWFAEPQQKRDFRSLTRKLKEQLGGQFPNATESDWREVADWLFGAAHP